MKTLLLLRHAKSSWDNPVARDFDRPLNDRGRKAARRMGAYMKKEGLTPDFILCSPSVRTSQTLDLLLQNFSRPPEAEFPEGLYHGGPEGLMAAIKSAPKEANRLLVIAHNPGMQALAMQLSAFEGSNRKGQRRIEEKYPTAALSSYTLDIDAWTEASPEIAKLEWFVTPKELG
jgi:phosphohistidine phosphatase